MLTATSPIAYPPTSPVTQKRAAPHASGAPKGKSRALGPFVLDEDDEELQDELHESRDDAPLAKRRMLEHPSQNQGGSVGVDTPGVGTYDNADGSGNVESVPTSPDSGSAPRWASQRLVFPNSILESMAPLRFTARTCHGTSSTIKQRKSSAAVSYETMVAARSKTKEGRAKRSFYGIEIHQLIDNASKELANRSHSRPNQPSAPIMPVETQLLPKKAKKSLLWTEKYRAKKFVDLCGDDSTNRHVLRWLKRWDSTVFPGQAKARPATVRRLAVRQQAEEEKPHRKILMLTGPPGLGKTTLAHVCAKQAGYEVLEVNASDDRSRDVVQNRIRTSLGTESVKTVANSHGHDGNQKLAKPVCVIVDEVDGVVAGSGASGEGGFVKALIDLVLVDQKNAAVAPGSASDMSRRKKKGDDFRLLRPLILICNDVYHPSLRPLRQSNLAEIIHVGRPSLDTVVGRVKNVMEREGIPCDKDAARKLCEAAWGMTSGIDARRGAESTVEGDLRGVMVVGEWVAGRFRSSPDAVNQKLTRQWIERYVLRDLSSSAAGARGLGRGNVRDITQRLFQEGGGFPKQAMDLSESKTKHEQPQPELGFGEQQKKYTMDRLREMVDTSGEISTIMTEIFSEYPNREFNDDIYLNKPNQAYDWLHFHDSCQSRLYTSQDWELAPYLSQPVLACHHLFASPKKHYGNNNNGYEKHEGEQPLPFTGPRADYQAREAEKQNRVQLQALQSQLSPTLTRSFRSPEDVATEFLPYLIRLVSPDVKPVVVGGSQGSMASVRKEGEKAMVQRASQVLAEVGVSLQRGVIEGETFGGRGPQYVYRLEPDLDSLSCFETSASLPSQAPTRYAVRQVLDQELRKTILLRESSARQARFQAGAGSSSSTPLPLAASVSLARDKENVGGRANKAASMVKRDFFGRIVQVQPLMEVDSNSASGRARKEDNKVWVTFHEGLNNAVRKPISLTEFLRAL